jgi:hypothetical protein
VTVLPATTNAASPLTFATGIPVKVIVDARGLGLLLIASGAHATPVFTDWSAVVTLPPAASAAAPRTWE